MRAWKVQKREGIVLGERRLVVLVECGDQARAGRTWKQLQTHLPWRRACKEGAVVQGHASQSRHAPSTRPLQAVRARVILPASPRNTPRTGTEATRASQLFAREDCAIRRLSSTPICDGLLLRIALVRCRRHSGRKASTRKRLHHAKRETGSSPTASSISIRWLMVHLCAGRLNRLAVFDRTIGRLPETTRSSWLAAESGANHPMLTEDQARLYHAKAQFPSLISWLRIHLRRLAARYIVAIRLHRDRCDFAHR
jgi:hypothetical protein